MIEVKELCGKRAAEAKVKQVSFKLQNGKTYGILGKSGAGTSTLLSLLAGSLVPTSGTVLINGFDMQTEAAKAKACLGYLPKDFSPYEDMTTLEYLLFIAEAKKVSYHRAVRQIHELLELTGLDMQKDKLIRFLSRLDVRLLGVVQTLIGKAEILLLDDPFMDLNAIEAQSVQKLLAHLGETKTLIIAGDCLTDLKALCSRILFFSDGALIEQLDCDDPLLEQTYENLPEEATPQRNKKENTATPRGLRILTEKKEEYEVIDTEEEEEND